MTTYRIQPIGAELHGIETETSAGNPAGGVHVFEGIGQVVACGEWYPQSGIELAEIDCEPGDLIPTGDYEGATLRTGRGRIVRRRIFRDTRRVSRWAELQYRRGN